MPQKVFYLPALLALAFFVDSPAHAQLPPLGPGTALTVTPTVGGGGSAPTIDGSSAVGNTTTSTLVLTFTTSQTQDLAVLMLDFAGNAVSSVTGCDLTWTQRVVTGAFAEYTAPAATVLSACSVTVTFNFATANNGLVFALHGNGATPPSPDVNVSLPSYNATGTTIYSTTNAADLAISYYNSGGTGTPSSAAGFTEITTAANNANASSLTLSATQSGTSVVAPDFPHFIVVDAFQD
jgi:hypothetical protein